MVVRRLYTREEFLKLPVEEVAEIVRAEGVPKVGVFMLDGSRRAAMLFKNLDPTSDGFFDKMIYETGTEFINNVKTIFDHGIHTLMIPTMNHANFNRNKKYIEKSLNVAFNCLFKDDVWLKFYEDYDIKVRVYGDFNYIMSKGLVHLKEMVDEIMELTAHHKKHRLFWGIGCTNNIEQARLMDMAVEFYKKHGRIPTTDEKFEMYYGEYIEPVDFLIRATEMRDSGVFPSLVDAHKTQLYFPVAPTTLSMTPDTFRRILYDLLYSRTRIFAIKEYGMEDISGSILDEVREYYRKNMFAVIGLGTAKGKFWLPDKWSE